MGMDQWSIIAMVSFIHIQSPWAKISGFNRQPIVETGHEIISTVILSLPLIQEGQLSVTGKRMCTKYW